MLSQRARSVLKILVNQYVQTASPVASEDIARLSATKVSSATVRSAMSQLSEEGYISRPHVSAGGIPSDLGYRYYVESLDEPSELPEAIRRQIYHHFDGADPDVDGWSQQCAAVLSRITENLSIVTVPRASSPRVKQIQLVYVTEYLALLIVVLQEARLLRRLVSLSEGVVQNQLDLSSSKLSEYFSGLTRGEIAANHPELTSLEERVARDTTAMMREEEAKGSHEHHMDGLRRLLHQPEFSQGDRARELVEMLEDQVLLGSVLSEVPEADDVGVYIGGENRQEALRSFGVILCRYGTPNHIGGTICVVGPTRMGYAEAIGGVRCLSSIMNRLVGELQGARSSGWVDQSSAENNSVE